jgi:hypothetical protein
MLARPFSKHMGIRLQCPNGHKVHVKSFLAGKRGVCPQCGAKFDIPANPNEASDDGGGEVISVVPSSPGAAATADDLGVASGGASQNAANRPRAARKASPNLLDPGTLDLDALSGTDGRSLLGGPAFGPAGQRLASRRKSAQTMRMFTLVLTAVVTLLACVLLYIVFRAR